MSAKQPNHRLTKLKRTQLLVSGLIANRKLRHFTWGLPSLDRSMKRTTTTKLLRSLGNLFHLHDIQKMQRKAAFG